MRKHIQSWAHRKFMISAVYASGPRWSTRHCLCLNLPGGDFITPFFINNGHHLWSAYSVSGPLLSSLYSYLIISLIL